MGKNASTPTLYNGVMYNQVSETAIFRIPGKRTPVEDYPVIDMHHIFVSEKGWNDPADLLTTHFLRPRRLRGVVQVKNRTYLLKFPKMIGFSVEEGESGISGNCNLFALGDCCWYKLCSSSPDFESTFRSMHEEARIYWIFRYVRGTWMDLLDHTMAEKYPLVTENDSRYQETLLELATTIEPLGDEAYHEYWKVVQQHVYPLLDSWHEVAKTCTKYVKYLVHHMLIDQDDLLWRTSRVFFELGQLDISTRDENFVIHEIPVPSTSFLPDIKELLPQDDSSTPLVNMPSNLSDSPNRTITELLSTTSHVDGHTNTEPLNAVQIPLSSLPIGKRKRSSSTDDALQFLNIVHESPNTHVANGAKQGSLLIKQTSALSDVQMRLVLSSKTTSNASGSNSKESLMNARDIITPHEQRRKRVLRPAAECGPPAAWSNLSSRKPVFRHSRLSKAARPFRVVTGQLAARQADMAVETFLSLMYEEDVADFCIADMVFAWERDYGERLEKVVALLTCHAKELLVRLSRLDRRPANERQEYESVNKHNIWRSTTFYNQLYKIDQINGQDSDLMMYIDWEAEHIFHALTESDGVWQVKEGSAPSATHAFARLWKPVGDHGITSDSASDEESNFMAAGRPRYRAFKGRSSLRPSSKTKTEMYIRNGAGPIRNVTGRRRDQPPDLVIQVKGDSISLKRQESIDRKRSPIITLSDDGEDDDSEDLVRESDFEVGAWRRRASQNKTLARELATSISKSHPTSIKQVPPLKQTTLKPVTIFKKATPQDRVAPREQVTIPQKITAPAQVTTPKLATPSKQVNGIAATPIARTLNGRSTAASEPSIATAKVAPKLTPTRTPISTASSAPKSLPGMISVAWRCKVPGCSFFQHEKDSIAARNVILTHYNAHADSILARFELLHEMVIFNSRGTSALTQRVEHDAIVWRDVMESDAVVSAACCQ